MTARIRRTVNARQDTTRSSHESRRNADPSTELHSGSPNPAASGANDLHRLVGTVSANHACDIDDRLAAVVCRQLSS
jgi:hypothetical protein